MIDLHSHTNESDGTLSPSELIDLAVATGLDALAITDHDTFAGYERAVEPAHAAGLELLRGIELSSRLQRPGDRMRWPHVLAYFPSGRVGASFRAWLRSQAADRKDRNTRLIRKLQEQGVQVTLEEVEAKGRSLAGRPHFAKLLVEKGYVRTADEAFRRYIGDDAPAFVERQSYPTAEVIRLIRAGEGIPVIAHPIRVGLDRDEELPWLASLKDQGLLGLEVYHSEQDFELQAHYLKIAGDLGLVPTGGSDFHGAAKPDILLGSGREGNVAVPDLFLEGLKAISPVLPFA